ncbi:hypothetical protein [Kumtagia ephedrae]|nr:hypothetical protein [Mesorhizobium ephedrae]
MQRIGDAVETTGANAPCSLPVEAMFVSQQRDTGLSHTFAPSRVVRTYGVPMHVDQDDLTATYRRQSLDEFLAGEARHAVGNYVMVDVGPRLLRIITAPGYCGGYVYCGNGKAVASTLLVSTLAEIPQIEMDGFPLCFFLQIAPKSSFSQLPCSTPFRDVRTLPPASVFEFEDGELTSCYSYLLTSGRLPPPKSFAEAIDEVTGRLAHRYQAQGKSTSLMFSGGVDSLVIYLSLREKMDAKDIRVFTMDHRNKTNGPVRAFPAARKLGFEIERVTKQALKEQAAIDTIKEMLSQDIVSIGALHYALIGRDIGARDILHGQNMDALANVNMTVLHANLEKGYLSKAKTRAPKTPAEANRQFTGFLGNLMFSELYLKDVTFQRETADFFASLNPSTMPDPDPGRAGIIRGMLSTQHPNLLTKASYPLDQIEGLDREAAIFSRFVGEFATQPRHVLDVLRFYTYSFLANKRNSTFPLPAGSRTLFVAMSGPIASYFVGRPRGLSRATQPKREIYGTARQLTGKNFSDLIAPDDDVEPQWQTEGVDEDALVRANLHYVEPANSRVLPAIEDATIRAYVERLYRDTLGSCLPERPGCTPEGRSRVRRILNLEFLLERASKSGGTSEGSRGSAIS